MPTDADTEAGRGEGPPTREQMADHVEDIGQRLQAGDLSPEKAGGALQYLARRLRQSDPGGEHNPNPRPIEGMDPEKYQAKELARDALDAAPDARQGEGDEVGRLALVGMTADALLRDYDDGRYSEEQVMEILREERDRRLRAPQGEDGDG